MKGFASVFAAVVALAAGAVADVIEDDMASQNMTELMKRQSTPSSTGMHNGYYYSWWTDGGSQVSYTNGAGGSYTVQWGGGGGNFVGGKGWNPGRSMVVEYEADYRPNGNSYLALYGWTQNPLVEYYVIENFGTYNPASQAQRRGTMQSGGATYDLYTSQRVNQPSIEGTSTFTQYWAVRAQKRSSGSINTQDFFTAWEGSGMRLGRHNYMIMATEGYFSSGYSRVNILTPPEGGSPSQSSQTPRPSSTTTPVRTSTTVITRTSTTVATSTSTAVVTSTSWRTSTTYLTATSTAVITSVASDAGEPEETSATATPLPTTGVTPTGIPGTCQCNCIWEM